MKLVELFWAGVWVWISQLSQDFVFKELGSRFAQANIDFRALCARMPQRPPKQFKVAPDSWLEVTGFLKKKNIINICICIYIYIYIYICVDTKNEENGRRLWRLSVRLSQPAACHLHHMANLRTKILDVRGFDSSRILILPGRILMSIGNFPESSSQRILVGVNLSREIGRSGLNVVPWKTQCVMCRGGGNMMRSLMLARA